VMNSVSNLWVIRDSLKTNCSQPQLCHGRGAVRMRLYYNVLIATLGKCHRAGGVGRARDRGREGDDAHAITPEVRWRRWRIDVWSGVQRCTQVE